MNEKVKGYITQKEFCEWFGVSAPVVGEYRKKGMPFKKKGQKVLIEKDVAEKWIAENIRAYKKKKDTPEKTDTEAAKETRSYNDERIRLTQLQADKLEIENQIKRGDFVEVEKVQEALRKVFLEAKTIIQSIEHEIDREIPDLAPDVMQLLKEKNSEALNKLANIKI